MNNQMRLIAAVIAGALTLTPAFAEQLEHKGHPTDHQMTHGGHCGMPTGEGIINAIDIGESEVSIAHKAIESLGWKETTNSFAVLKPVDLAAFAIGEHVHFMLKPEKKNAYSVAMMCSLDADEGMHNVCMAQMRTASEKLAAAAGNPCMNVGRTDGDTEYKGHDGHH